MEHPQAYLFRIAADVAAECLFALKLQFEEGLGYGVGRAHDLLTTHGEAHRHQELSETVSGADSGAAGGRWTRMNGAIGRPRKRLRGGSICRRRISRASSGRSLSIGCARLSFMCPRCFASRACTTRWISSSDGRDTGGGRCR